MKLRMNFNFLILRYIMIDFDIGKTNEYLILQLPWWNLKTALFKGTILWTKEVKY